MCVYMYIYCCIPMVILFSRVATNMGLTNTEPLLLELKYKIRFLRALGHDIFVNNQYMFYVYFDLGILIQDSLHYSLAFIHSASRINLRNC